MLAFVIFAVTALIFLLIALVCLYPGSKKVTTIPGLDPSHPKDGNLADIGKAGSLHEFLIKLHEEFGSIASFWFGQVLYISIASPELFKQSSHLYNRPYDLFAIFEPLLTVHSIQYAKDADARKRRKNYEPPFSYKGVEHQYKLFNQISKEYVEGLKAIPKEEHIPIKEHMLGLALKFITKSSYGDLFKSDSELVKITKAYEVCWGEMEKRLDGIIPSSDSPRQKNFESARDALKGLIIKALNSRKALKIPAGEEIFIDTLLAMDMSNEVKTADAITYLVAGIHTTGLMLTWCIYFLATHKDVEKRLYKEIIDNLEEEDVTAAVVGSLKYLRQVLDETMRCSVLAPFAARVQENEGELGGHKVAAGTPVIEALGVLLQDSEIWPEPNKFDPDRFSEEEKKKRSPYAFMPFGFAGGRMCPGYALSYAEATVLIVSLVRKFKFELVEGQVVIPEYGIVTTPKDEIWITVKSRK